MLGKALKIAQYAYEKASSEFGYDAGFYGMEQADVEGRKCLIISIVIAEPQIPTKYHGFEAPLAQTQSADEDFSNPLRLLKRQPAHKIDEHKQ